MAFQSYDELAEKQSYQRACCSTLASVVLTCGMAGTAGDVQTALLPLSLLQICDGASPEERERWKLKPAKEFHYLNQSTCFEIPGDSNAEEFKVCPVIIA